MSGKYGSPAPGAPGVNSGACAASASAAGTGAVATRTANAQEVINKRRLRLIRRITLPWRRGRRSVGPIRHADQDLAIYDTDAPGPRSSATDAQWTRGGAETFMRHRACR